MREYGQIQSGFWHSTDCQDYSDRGKLLAAFLMSGPYTNGLGCFRLTNSNLLEDLKWDEETVEQTFSELTGNGWAYRFEKVVLMPKFLYWNKVANPNMAKARFAEWEQIPKGPIKAYAAQVMLLWCEHWTDAHRAALQAVSETVSETIEERFGKPSGNGLANKTRPEKTRPVDQTKPNQTKNISPTAHSKNETNGKDLLGDDLTKIQTDEVKAVVDAYHEALPKCQRVTILNDKRRKRVLQVVKIAKSFCKSNGWDYDGKEFFTSYFEECAKDPWMRGDVPNPKSSTWKQNLEVLLAEDRFANVLDRAFDAQERSP